MIGCRQDRNSKHHWVLTVPDLNAHVKIIDSESRWIRSKAATNGRDRCCAGPMVTALFLPSKYCIVMIRRYTGYCRPDPTAYTWQRFYGTSKDRVISESRSELKTPLQWKVMKAINAVWTYAKKGIYASAYSDLRGERGLESPSSYIFRHAHNVPLTRSPLARQISINDLVDTWGYTRNQRKIAAVSDRRLL